MAEESTRSQQKKKQSAPAYSQRQAEERLTHFMEVIPEMKHPSEMENVLTITKDISESGFDVSKVHQILAERAMSFVIKNLEENSLHFVEEFLTIVKKTIANVSNLLLQTGEMAFSTAMKKLEEGDIGMVRRFYSIGKLATNDLQNKEEDLESRIMNLANEKINSEDTLQIVENYLGISKLIKPDLTPQRQSITEKSLKLAERALDQNKFELVEKYVGISALAGGDITSSEEYLAKKVISLAEKEIQVPIKERNIDLCWQLIRIINSVSGDAKPLETKLVTDIEARARSKRNMQILRALVIFGVVVGLVYGYFWWMEQERLAKIEEEKKADDKRQIAWAQKLSSAKIGAELYSLSGHSDGITSVTISSDNKYVVSVGNDLSSKIWRLNDDNLMSKNKPFIELPHNSSAVLSVSTAVREDGTPVVFIAGHNMINVFELLTGKSVRTIDDAHSDWINTLTTTSDNKFIVSGSVDKLVRMRGIDDGKLNLDMSGHTGAVLSVVASSDNKYIVSSSEDSTIRIWSTNDRNELHLLKGQNDAVKCVSISSTQGVIVSGSSNGFLILWNISDGLLKKKIELGVSINSVAFTSDGKEFLAALGNGEVTIFSTDNLTVNNKLKLHSGSISSLAISSTSAFFVTSGSEDNLVKIIKLH